MIAETLKKNIFLIDGTGAVLTAINVGLILSYFQEYIGMPKLVLFLLSLAGVFFACYSLYHHFYSVEKWRNRLKLIALFNSLYCIATVILCVMFKDQLTSLAYAYFVLEIMIVIALVVIEIRLANNKVLDLGEIK